MCCVLHVISPNIFPKPLSSKDEKKYLNLLSKGDKNAKDKLIKHNLRLVAHIVKKYYSSKNYSEDLISIGTIGLIKAINTFNFDKGIKLSSYAARCIENAILPLWIQFYLYIFIILSMISTFCFLETFRFSK